ncbi:MAG: HEAT repeat domain-containing protein [candidate division WOR-3 bacterium]
MPLKRREEEIPKFDSERRRRDRNFESLISQLDNPSASERRWAARDLAQYSEASPYLLKFLQKERDISVREVILSSLLAIKDEVAIKGLIDLLNSDDALLRNEVIETLKEMPEEVAPYIEKLINQDNSDLRIFAINIMESLRHPKVLVWLKEILEKDKNVNVIANALDLVAEVGTEEFLPLIEKVKDTFKDEPYIQFVADLAIGRINEGKVCDR